MSKTRSEVFVSTGEIGKLSQSGESLFGIKHSNWGPITFPCGVPLKNG